MPQPDITNPDYIKFFIESCEKTARLRQKWNTIHQEQLQQAAVLTRPNKNLTDIDVFKANILGGIAATTRDFISSGYNRRCTPIRDAKTVPRIDSLRKEHSIPAVGLGHPKEDPRLARPDTDLSPDPIMRPVNPALKKILMKPKPFFGRVVYLKNREKIKPDDRYYFAETTSWDYGWRLKDTPFGRAAAPQCGMVNRLYRDQMGRVGPQPDPYYYREPVKTMRGPCDV